MCQIWKSDFLKSTAGFEDREKRDLNGMLKVTSIQLSAGQYKKEPEKVTSDQSASEDKSLAN